jgi:hypothetical protein
MSTATLEDAPTEDRVLVSQPDGTVLFMSRRSNLRLVKRPIRIKRDAEGNAIDQTAGETIEFKEGVFRCPIDGECVLTNGERLPSSIVVKWLEGHILKDDTQEGFWRVDPTAPPLSPQELATLQDLAISLDAEGLERLIREEQAGWAREELLTVAQGTLDRVEARLESIAAEQKAAVDAALEGAAKAAAADKPAGKAKAG